MYAVIPSVDYADFLSYTLPEWRQRVEHITVVTAPHDRESQDLAEQYDCRCLVTKAWWHNGAVFNKARALDLAFEAVEPGQWCLALDADVLPFGAMPDLSGLDGETLYGVHRRLCTSPQDLAAFRAGQLAIDRFPKMKMWARRPAWWSAGFQGYFQLWRRRPGLAFGDSSTAEFYDVEFGLQFLRRMYLSGLWCLHLGANRRNWKGRVTPQWS